MSNIYFSVSMSFPYKITEYSAEINYSTSNFDNMISAKMSQYALLEDFYTMKLRRTAKKARPKIRKKIKKIIKMCETLQDENVEYFI